ncbi:MAG: hypothetical protein K8I00_04275 [Candidatus Omnitrophica bacterium]|nr:hypothetical protein [Candidatus Omnitrophota bacterium]
MALLSPIIVFIDQCITEQWRDPQGLRMLELGNQVIRNEFWGREYTPVLTAATGKEYYTAMGIDHTSIDMNGEDGALAIDLSQPLPTDIELGGYDVVTNAGTTEHVEPVEAQYECFKTIHELTKVHGLMIHFVPGPAELKTSGLWKYHCNNYYPFEFFQMLSQQNGYRLVHQVLIEDLVTVCLEKTTDQAFMSDRNLLCSHIVRKNWGIVYEGINDDGISRSQAFLFKVLRKLHKRRMTSRHQKSG